MPNSTDQEIRAKELNKLQADAGAAETATVPGENEVELDNAADSTAVACCGSPPSSFQGTRNPSSAEQRRASLQCASATSATKAGYLWSAM